MKNIELLLPSDFGKNDFRKQKLLINKLKSLKVLDSENYEISYRGNKKEDKGQYVIILEDNKIKDFIICSRDDMNGRNTLILQNFVNSFLKYKELINNGNINNSLKCKFIFLLNEESWEYKITSYNIIYLKIINFWFKNVEFIDDINEILKNSEIQISGINDFIFEKKKLLKNHNRPSNIFYTDNSYYLNSKTDGTNKNEIYFLCLWFLILNKNLKLIPFNDEKNNNNFEVLIKILNKLEFLYKNIGDLVRITNYDISGESIDVKSKLITEDKKEIRNQVIFKWKLNELYKNIECFLCDCNIIEIIEAAHIFPVSEIKKLKESFDNKKDIAIDPYNGLFLCKNHHNLFDRKIIIMKENGSIDIRINDSRPRDWIKKSILVNTWFEKFEKYINKKTIKNLVKYNNLN